MTNTVAGRPTPTATGGTAPARPALAVAAGVTGMTFVGGSVAASGVLAGAPLLTAQGIRYAAAGALLVLIARMTRRPVARPRGREWVLLLGVAGCGLVLFNIALVHGARHAEPAVLGVAVACVPLLMAAIGPVLEGRPPAGRVLAAAAVVTVGAVLVQGLGRADALGIVWAVIVFGCEAGFTLLAVPLLPRLGAYGVSVHATWLAAAGFCLLGLATEGPGAAARLTVAQWLVVGYLAVAVTAIAFVLWYGAVATLGAGRAGLLTGVAPVAAAVGGVVLGGPVPRLPVWAGVAVVAVGLALGLSSRTGRVRRAAVAAAGER